MIIEYTLDKDAKAPTRAHSADAGFDIYARQFIRIEPKTAVMLNTGLHVAIPCGYVGILYNRSGLNVRGCTLHGNGVIDSGYTGSVGVKLYNDGNETIEILPGDRVAQMIIEELVQGVEFVQVEKLNDTDRGDRGFGSTGR